MPASTAEKTNRPVHTVRHRSLKATIWRNQTEKGDLYNVTVIRSYRDKESGEWRDSHSLRYDDLMNVAALMYEAHATISRLIAKTPRKSAARPVAKVAARPRATQAENLPY